MATSSRRRPAVRRRLPGGSPTSAGRSRSRRDRSSCPSSLESPPGGMASRVLMPVPVTSCSGYQCIAPEFDHRDTRPGHWLGRDDAGRQEGFALLHRLTREQALADVAAASDWLRAVPGIEHVAMIGFSAGGHLSYLAACRLPLAATAVLYGGWLPTTDIPMSQPSPTLDLTPEISGRILYLTGEDDALIDAGQRRQIRDALQAAGVNHELVAYPGAAHAFFWPGTPPFNQEARDDAWSRILAMLAS